MRWKLSLDGRKVATSEVLEYHTDLISDPTTGAIGDNLQSRGHPEHRSNVRLFILASEVRTGTN